MVKRYKPAVPTGTTVHRIIPATGKHGWKTACGIETKVLQEGSAGLFAPTLDGKWNVAVSERGKPFDCTRCRRVLELKHNNETFSIGRGR